MIRKDMLARVKLITIFQKIFVAVGTTNTPHLLVPPQTVCRQQP